MSYELLESNASQKLTAEGLMKLDRMRYDPSKSTAYQLRIVGNFCKACALRTTYGNALRLLRENSRISLILHFLLAYCTFSPPID